MNKEEYEKLSPQDKHLYDKYCRNWGCDNCEEAEDEYYEYSSDHL